MGGTLDCGHVVTAGEGHRPLNQRDRGSAISKVECGAAGDQRT